MIYFLPVLCLFACVLSLIFDAKGLNKLSIKAKLAASLAFVGFAWEQGAWESRYGQILFIGFLMSSFGDFFLALKGNKKWFIFGIAAFLLAHIFYTVGFFQTGFVTARLPLVVPIVLVALILVVLWLHKHLPNIFKIAVPIYLVTIGVMLIFAWSNQADRAFWWMTTGATLFAISDLFVARNRFFNPDILNRFIGLPLYYIAQLILAYSVSFF